MADQRKIQLLSDTVLYREAQDFIKQNSTIDGQKQLYSLVNYSQTWEELEKFVAHQKERDWLGSKTYYKQFYMALHAYLKQLRDNVEKEWFSPEAELTKVQRRKWVDDYAILVAREFFQHLTAENLYREVIR